MANYGKLNFAVSLNPTSAFPLDNRTYFESMDEALAAASTAGPAGSKDTAYHFGMTLTVYENGAVSKFIIQPNKTLLQLTTAVEVTQEEYDQMKAAGNILPGVMYLISREASE